MQTDNPLGLLSPDEVAALIPGMTKELLAKLRYQGTGPRFLKPTPRTVVYRTHDIVEWLAASEQVSTSDAQ